MGAVHTRHKLNGTVTTITTRGYRGVIRQAGHVRHQWVRLCWNERIGQAVRAYLSWMRARTRITCRTVRVARLRPPQLARSPRHVPRPADRRGRAAARLEARRYG